MAIKTPHWAAKAGAYPHPLGWVVDRPKGRVEVLRKGTFTAEEIAEWHGNTTPAPQPVLQTLHEAPVVETVVEPELVSFHYDSEIGEDVDNEEE